MQSLGCWHHHKRHHHQVLSTPCARSRPCTHICPQIAAGHRYRHHRQDGCVTGLESQRRCIRRCEQHVIDNKLQYASPNFGLLERHSDLRQFRETGTGHDARFGVVFKRVRVRLSYDVCDYVRLHEAAISADLLARRFVGNAVNLGRLNRTTARQAVGNRGIVIVHKCLCRTL